MQIRRFLRGGLAAIAVLCAAMAIVPTLLAQSQQPVGMTPQATTTLGRWAWSLQPFGPQAKLGFNNLVTLEWRHCDKYAKKTGHLWWKKSVIDQEACNTDPTTLFDTQSRHNLVTDAGFDFASKVLSDTAAQPAACNYIAVSNDATSPAAADTTLASEIAANGLSRAQGTFAHTAGTKTYTVSKVFTATGTQASQKTGLFNASSSGTLCYEVAYTQVTVNNNDTLTVTWTITLSGT